MNYNVFRNILILLSVLFGFQQCSQKSKETGKQYVPTEKDMSAYMFAKVKGDRKTVCPYRERHERLSDGFPY